MMMSSIKAFLFCMLASITTGQDLASNLKVTGSLHTWGIDDGRPSEGSAKQAVWLGDWNNDGTSEYFVTTKKGGTSSFFYSTGEGTWQHTPEWYAPSYSVIALDTEGDARPEYIIKTSKFQTNENITKEMFEDYVPGLKRSWTTVFKIPEDPINNPLEPVMTFDRSVPIIQGCVDIDGDGYKDLLVTHHLEKSKYVARYYKGKDDSSDGKPFESTHQWASTGEGSSMSGSLGEHKARWGDLQIINDGSTVRKRLFAVGSEGENNNVIYWDYHPDSDTFDSDPTVLDVSMLPAAVNNELHLVSVRALPGAIMLAGKDGAFFFKYSSAEDSYTPLNVPGITPTDKIEYSDFWCFNSGLNDGKMVFVILRKPTGNKDSAMEFRSFDPSLPEDQISDIFKEIALPAKAQRITALRVDDSFDTMLDVKQLIVAHKQGATILDVVSE